ncbi:unnamed protein product [Staurois parvus]|uniref:Uncharacterized protein n=1 Tax=Staurois parvus TaxID=386267 RepID=A0ABN9ERZ1_9NEOB|nr:unnamed protein product [Staurois parvus]
MTGAERTVWVIFGDKIVDVAEDRVVDGFVSFCLILIRWAIGSQMEGLAERGGGH